jgi:23S rRNA pseudouridine2605 synthase
LRSTGRRCPGASARGSFCFTSREVFDLAWRPARPPDHFDLLPKQLPRLISVGRLDLNTEGLLLLTNDGSLARALELPSTGWLRRYRVRAHGRVTQQALDSLRDGITIDGVRYGPIEATADRLQATNV